MPREIELETSSRTTAPKRRLRNSDSTASSRSSASSEIARSPSRVRRNAVRSVISISGKSQSRKCAIVDSSGIEQAACADADEARQPFGDLDAREPLLARLRVAHGDAEAQRQARDVRERLARADGERRQDRVDLAGEDRAKLGELVLGRVVDRADENPLAREGGAELVAPQPRLARRQLGRALAHLDQRLLRRPPVGRPHRESRGDLVEQAGDAHHEELVEDRRDDPAEADALEQRLAAVGCDLEHARHQVERRQLAIQERQRLVFGIHSLSCRHRRRIS